MSIELRVDAPLSNPALNALFSAGGVGAGWPVWQKNPDTSDWQPVLHKSLVWIAAVDPSLSTSPTVVDGLVGFVNVAWDGRDHAFLLDTRVHPEHRHRDLGQQLVAAAAERARAAGCLVLHVDHSDDLTPFYASCGFVSTAAGLLHLA